MEIQEVRSADLGASLGETKTDSQEYELTDRQVSNTASIQFESLSGQVAVLTL
jgi:hypothetical protein